MNSIIINGSSIYQCWINTILINCWLTQFLLIQPGKLHDKSLVDDTSKLGICYKLAPLLVQQLCVNIEQQLENFMLNQDSCSLVIIKNDRIISQRRTPWTQSQTYHWCIIFADQTLRNSGKYIAWLVVTELRDNRINEIPYAYIIFGTFRLHG